MLTLLDSSLLLFCKNMDLERTCRVCLEPCPEDSELATEIEQEYSDITGCTIAYDEPRKVCKACITFINDYRSFRERCVLTQVVLERRHQETEVICKLEERDPEPIIETFEVPPDIAWIKSESDEQNEPTQKPKRKARKKTSKPAKKRKLHACKTCEFTCVSLASFKNHMTSKHTGFTAFYCDLCDCKTPYRNKEYLKKHMKSKHLGAIFDCTDCDRRYTTYTSMYYHRQLAHTPRSEYAFKCSVCNKRFALKQHLKLHEVTHDAEKKYKCEQCPTECARKDQLSKHIRRFHTEVTAETHVCDICSKKFAYPEYLKAHKRIHATDTYRCPCCPRAFNVPSTLRNHVKRLHPQFKMPPLRTVLKGVNLNQLEYD